MISRTMLLNAHGAARLLGTSERQIYRWVDDNEIPCRRVRDQLRFNPTDLLEWASAQRMAVHVEAFEDDDPRDPPPSLAAALRAGSMYAVDGNDREAILRAVVDMLPLPDDADRELLVEIMLARETSGLAAVGGGLAIPHVHDPIVASGGNPTATVCYVPGLSGLAAPDGQPIRTMIVLVVPTIRTHLRLIARLARAIADPELRSALERRASLDELAHEVDRIEAAPPPVSLEDVL